MLESLPDPDTSSEDLASSRFTWVKVHQAALGALYHVPISSAMVRKLGRHFIISLANTADFYACSDAVSTQIHNITMAEPQRQRILTSCKKEPLAMLRFGMTIKAEWIAKEASIYLICCSSNDWRRFEKINIADLDSVLRSILAKREELQQTLKNVDLALLAARPKGFSFEYRLAIDLFRHWLTDAMVYGRASSVGKAYAVPYRTISSGVPFDLERKHIEQHLGVMARYWSLDGLDWETIQLAWEKIFKHAAEVAQPLLRDKTLLKSPTEGDDDLRCLSIDREDLPWTQRD